MSAHATLMSARRPVFPRCAACRLYALWKTAAVVVIGASGPGAAFLGGEAFRSEGIERGDGDQGANGPPAAILAIAPVRARGGDRRDVEHVAGDAPPNPRCRIVACHDRNSRRDLTRPIGAHDAFLPGDAGGTADRARRDDFGEA